jgi:hypothetical protein
MLTHKPQNSGPFLQTKRAREGLNLLKQISPSQLFRITKLMIGSAAIIISSFSFIRSITVIKKLAKGKAYIGNDPYWAAAVLMLMICIGILIWGFRSLTNVTINTMRKHNKRGDWEFENYEKVGKALVQKQIPSYTKNRSKSIDDKDFSFVVKFLSFLGVIILFLFIKSLIPEEYYWRIHLTPGYFRFPFYFIAIITVVAVIRTTSFFLHTRSKTQVTKVSKAKVRIKGEGDPYMLAPVIEETLCKIQYNDNPNIHARFGFTATEGTDKKSGRTERKLFIETHPKPIPYEPHPIVSLYLVLAVILLIIGIILMTTLPPDNISVLSVPTIAIGHLWNIVKGIILLFCGQGFLASVSGIYHIHWFESIMVSVEVKGVYRNAEAKEEDVNESLETGNTEVQSDYNVSIYSTKLLTEIYFHEGKKNKGKVAAPTDAGKDGKSTTQSEGEEIRHIISMNTDNSTKKAEELVLGAIKTFAREANHER